MNMNDTENKQPAEEEKYLDGALFAKMAKSGAAHLRANADEVNNLNVFPVPDGDTGDNMSMTIESGVEAMKKVETINLAEVMQAMSKGMLLGARGNSGVILSQFFSGMAKGFESNDKADPFAVAEALEAGVKQAYSSVLTPTEGTILTVAREAVEYAVSRLDDNSTIRSLFSDLTQEMQESLRRTPELLEVLRESSVVDSGGAGLLYIMEGFNKVLIGEDTYADTAGDSSHSRSHSDIDFSKFNEDSEMLYGYCTELLLQLTRKKTDLETFDVSVIQDFLKSVGNSIVSFRDGNIVKIHVHTMTPDKVLGFCLKYGEFLTVKIENMSVQHNESIGNSEKGLQDKPEIRPDAEKKREKFATVAVCIGRGIEETFREIGVDVIVRGGQTKNPSAEDFIAAFDQLNADHIFVLPNNGNIIMAAKQAASIYKKADIIVIESKDLGQGYIAAAYINFEAETPEDAIGESLASMKNVTTGSISEAIRDANMNGVRVSVGDSVGIVGKNIVTSKASRIEAAEALSDYILGGSDNDKSILTVFRGKDAEEEECTTLRMYVEEKYPDIELYVIDGGQEIYSYILVAE